MIAVDTLNSNTIRSEERTYRTTLEATDYYQFSALPVQVQYDKYPSQTSAPVYLEAGQRYYIEALHREYRGIDHLSVGWMMPGGMMEQAISGQYLRPYVEEMDPLDGMVSESGLIAKARKGENRAEELSPLQVYPNPFHRDLTVDHVHT